MPRKRMIVWTLRERLKDRKEVRNPTIRDTELIVQVWLRSCAKQAERDGHGTASDVLKKLAEHLKAGVV